VVRFVQGQVWFDPTPPPMLLLPAGLVLHPETALELHMVHPPRNLPPTVTHLSVDAYHLFDADFSRNNLGQLKSFVIDGSKVLGNCDPEMMVDR
jgi:hypothetical protein